MILGIETLLDWLCMGSLFSWNFTIRVKVIYILLGVLLISCCNIIRILLVIHRMVIVLAFFGCIRGVSWLRYILLDLIL